MIEPGLAASLLVPHLYFLHTRPHPDPPSAVILLHPHFSVHQNSCCCGKRIREISKYHFHSVERESTNLYERKNLISTAQQRNLARAEKL